MPGFRFHDLRHTGQTLAASTGATVKDLMRRLGHASPAAAYSYLHTVDGRDAEIASALSALAAHGDPAKLPRTIVGKALMSIVSPRPSSVRGSLLDRVGVGSSLNSNTGEGM